MDFWSPPNFRKYVYPSLRNEAKLCHETDTLFAYVLVRGSIPLIDQVLEAGVDILQGVDPVMDPYMDMKKLKEKVKGKMSLWGGVNEAVTIQSGSEDEIRSAVKKAMVELGSDGGLVLSPVENVLITTDEEWNKVLMFINAWKNICDLT